MNLVVDIGNTRAKICIVDNQGSIQYSRAVEATLMHISNAIDSVLQEYQVQHSVVCSVSVSCDKVLEKLKILPGMVLELSADTPLPIRNMYSTPSTLGRDRIAAAVGAAHLFPGCNVLIVDAGTAVTFDFLRNGNEYIGGNIAPGVSMRLKSLHEYTARLPLVRPMENADGFGTSTEKALSNGAVVGLVREIEGYANDFEKKNVNSRIILTGGDCIFLSKKLKNTIFAEPNLVTIGLNRILNYNVSKKN
jgi:type III pantothenate kinase